MKNISLALFVASVLLTTGLGVSNPLAIAPSQAAPQITTGSKATLMARRWGFRFRVRASRYRRGGFSRSGDGCPVEKALIPVTPQHNSEGEGLNEMAPAYLTAADHPTFFVYVPELPATQGKFTLFLDGVSMRLSSELSPVVVLRARRAAS